MAHPSEPAHDRRDVDRDRLDALELQVRLLTTTLTDMITINKEIRDNSRDMVNLISTVHSGMKFLGYVGQFAKWLTLIVVAISALWAIVIAIKTGAPPAINIDIGGPK